jgi:abortive infection alpha-like protein
MLPVTDEQAKLGQEIVKALRDSGSYVADILGDLPRDLLGLLIGDRVKARRIEKAVIVWEKTKERLRDWNVPETEPPSRKFAIPILEAAVDEDNEDLQDLLARLLATAMDPARRDEMRQAFVETVKQMDPMDALVLEAIRKNGGEQWLPSGVQAVAASLSCSHDEVIVSFQHLAKLECITFTDSTGPRIMPYLTPFGKLLTNVVSGPP